jgi:S1-C subfamily serine protease
MTKFHCPKCGVGLKITGPVAGKRIQCSKCGNVFSMSLEEPSHPAGEDAQPPADGPKRAPDARPLPPTQPKSPRVPPAPSTVEPASRRSAAKRPPGKRKKDLTAVIVAVVAVGAVLAIGGTVAIILIYMAYLKPEGNSFAQFGTGTKLQPVPMIAQAEVKPGPFDTWLKDLEQAKNTAREEKKDILLLFGRSARRASAEDDDEVLAKPEFRERVSKAFVFVYLDFVWTRTILLQKEYPMDEPAMLLADASGRPYAQESYSREEGAATYAARVLELQGQRRQRDQLFAAVDKADKAAKLPPTKAAVAFLKEHKLLPFYRTLLSEWTALSHTYDPDNAQGYVEVFFEVDWLASAREVHRGQPDAISKYVARLDDWKKTYRFKDPDCAVRLLLTAAYWLRTEYKYERALTYVNEARAFKPTDTQLLQELIRTEAVLRYSGSGTCFVVSREGYLMTNHHVIEGPSQTLVQFPKIKDPLPAEVVAKDKKLDVALLRIKGIPPADLKPLRLAVKRPVYRGEKVAAFGYPLWDIVGSGLKLTTGVVSSLADASSHDMFVLDIKVNPGNSGGPLCDASGNVVGLITAKSVSGYGIESYGMARPVADLDAFLKKNLKDYQPAALDSKPPLAGEELDRLVSPSVFMVLRRR